MPPEKLAQDRTSRYVKRKLVFRLADLLDKSLTPMAPDKTPLGLESPPLTYRFLKYKV